jgi:O-antigen/teichoic acid export membrane protein
VSALLGDPQVGMVVVASIAFFTHAAGVGVAVLHADIDYKQSESLRILGSVLGLFATVALIGFGARDAGSMLVAVYAGTALANLGLAFSVKSDIPPGDAPVDGRRFAKESLILGAGGVVRQTYYSLNPILARALGGDVAGARFAPAYRLCGLSILISVYFGAAAMPAMVRLHSTDRPALNRFTVRWTLLLAGVGLGIAGFLYIFRVDLMTLLFGADYADSANVLAPMCITTVAIHAGGLALVRLVAEGRDRAALLVSVAGLVANVLSNLALTRSMGAEGAAWSSVATETVVTLGAYAALFIK